MRARQVGAAIYNQSGNCRHLGQQSSETDSLARDAAGGVMKARDRVRANN